MEVSLNRNDIRNFVLKRVEKFSESKGSESDVIKRLFSGEHHFSGYYGKVLIDNGKAYKLISDIRSEIIEEPDIIYLTIPCIQNIMPILIDIIIYYESQKLFNIYTKVIDFYKYNDKCISIYKAYNRNTIDIFIRSNKNNYDKLDQELLRAIYQISKLLEILDKRYLFVHSDLKLDNVLVHKNEDRSYNYVISDFDKTSITIDGLSIKQRSFRRSKTRNDIIERKKNMYTICPRINDKKEYTKGDIEGHLFRDCSDSNINIDIYVFMLSIIFHTDIKNNISHYPLLMKFYSKIFDKNGMYRINKCLRSKYNIKGIYGPIHFIITRGIRLRHNIYDHINLYINEIQEERSIKLTDFV